MRCFGHIAASVGAETVELDAPRLSASQLIDDLRARSKPNAPPGFSKFNTLILVNDGEAVTAASREASIQDGDEVFLVPFSHGG